MVVIVVVVVVVVVVAAAAAAAAAAVLNIPSPHHCASSLGEHPARGVFRVYCLGSKRACPIRNSAYTYRVLIAYLRKVCVPEAFSPKPNY